MPSIYHVIGEIEIKRVGKAKPKQERTGMISKSLEGFWEKVQNTPSILWFPKGHWKIKTYQNGFDDVNDEEAEEIAYVIC